MLAGFLIYTGEGGVIGGATRAIPMRNLWIRTERASERHSFSRIALNITCCNDLGRWSSFLDPSLQRRYKVMIGVGRLTRNAAISKTICADAASAVAHSRHHEQPIEIRYGRGFARGRPVFGQKAGYPV